MAHKVQPMIAVNAHDLRNALNFVRQVIERRTTIPILGTVRITSYDDRISLRGTDLDIEAEIIVPAECEGALDITLSPRWLSGLISWHDGLVTIRHEVRDRDGEVATIEAGDVWAEARCLSAADDWPPVVGESRHVIAGEGWSKPITIAEATLKRAMDSTYGTISTEETRYYLNGVFAVAVDGELRCVSTDGHRLSLYDTGVEWSGLSAIIQRKTVQLLSRRMIAGGNGAVRVSQLIRMAPKYPKAPATSGKGSKVRAAPEPAPEMVPWAAVMRFSGDVWTITSKMIDGTYPEYTRVVPPPADDISVTMSLAALRRFPAPGYLGRAVKIHGDAGTITQIDAEGSKVRMPCQGKGEAFGVNLIYLMDFARQSGTIRLAGRSPSDPFRVLSEDPKLLQVVMPMRV